MSEQTETKMFWHIREIGTGESVEAVEVRPGMSDREERHLMADTLCDAIHVIEDYQRVMETREYALACPTLMPSMDGSARYTLVSGVRFKSAEQADAARQAAPVLADALIVSRIAPVGNWEECYD